MHLCSSPAAVVICKVAARYSAGNGAADLRRIAVWRLPLYVGND